MARPGCAVKNILLYEREERFHRGIVRAGSDPAHQALRPVEFQGGTELSRPQLQAAITMDNHTMRTASFFLIASSRAATTRRDVTREPVAYPTILRKHKSLTAHR